MRVHLMHRDADWDQEPALTERFRSFRRLPGPELSALQQALVQDLDVETLVGAMARGDEFLAEVALAALLPGLRNGAETIRYRQPIVRDCLSNPAQVRQLYALAVDAIATKRRYYIGESTRHSSSILYSAIEALQMFVGMLRSLRDIAAASAGRFESAGFTTLFGMIGREFSEEYLAGIENHLTQLKFRQGVLVSARLGKGNEGADYVLRQPHDDGRSWLDRLLGKGPPAYTFYIAEQDQAGAEALGEIRNRALSAVANALAQSADHILSFFEALRAELAFYVGCLNLHEALAALGAPVCFPEPLPLAARRQHCRGLYDVGLALRAGRRVVGNDLDADARSLVVITGANQGGKSTFLRGIGLAQLMMQAGMFVGADAFAGELCSGLFTHYKREEDATMKHGKLDEELARISEIADVIGSNAILLCNESFASTNEREGSEIARQVVCAMLEKRIKVFVVTHLYEFARGMFARNMDEALFLRADRAPDGTRTFKLSPGEPLETSYGEDLYREIFGGSASGDAVGSASADAMALSARPISSSVGSSSGGSAGSTGP